MNVCTIYRITSPYPIITKDYFLDLEINRMKKIVVTVAALIPYTITLYYLPLKNPNFLNKIAKAS